MGGIVAAVLVSLLLLGVLLFGVWFAYSRGYFDSECLPSPAARPTVPVSGRGPDTGRARGSCRGEHPHGPVSPVIPRHP